MQHQLATRLRGLKTAHMQYAPWMRCQKRAIAGQKQQQQQPRLVLAAPAAQSSPQQRPQLAGSHPLCLSVRNEMLLLTLNLSLQLQQLPRTASSSSSRSASAAAESPLDATAQALEFLTHLLLKLCQDM